MNQRLLFEGRALWIHDFEIQQMGYNERFIIRHFYLLLRLPNMKDISS